MLVRLGHNIPHAKCAIELVERRRPKRTVSRGIERNIVAQLVKARQARTESGFIAAAQIVDRSRNAREGVKITPGIKASCQRKQPPFFDAEHVLHKKSGNALVASRIRCTKYLSAAEDSFPRVAMNVTALRAGQQDLPWSQGTTPLRGNSRLLRGHRLKVGQ